MFDWFKSKFQLPRTLGQIGEEIAQLEYKKKGFAIIAKNEFNRKGKSLGEIDFIAKGGRQVFFVEVKTRTKERGVYGTALEAVDCHKQAKILKAVKLFLLQHAELGRLIPQIDVCAVVIRDLSRLELVSKKPDKYRVAGDLDTLPDSVTIIANAVEDWN